jgi:ribosomal protein S18 acetylase RimI-like enzyme
MKTVRFWEETGANVWPAFEQLLYDGWLLRFTPGYATHNNSVWPLYPGALPLEEKITFCERQYAERGATCGFRLSALPGHDRLEERLRERGYGVENPNWVMSRASLDAPDAEVVELALDDWLDTAYQIHPVDDPQLKAWERQVLRRGALPRRFAVVIRGGQACAYGYATRQDNVLDLRDLWTRPEQRGQGIGTQLICGLLGLGRQDGAAIACLAVNEANVGARRLYERLGFVVRYQYRYLVATA